MTNNPPQRKRQISAPIIIAIISLIGVCITTAGVIIVGIFPNILNALESDPNKTEAIIFRVTEASGVSVAKAKVILLSGNDIHIQYTDSNGASIFNIIKTETLRVFVETDQYEIYDQIISSNMPNPIEIRLNPKDVSRKSVIIRVIDDKDDMPINGAEVILVANGNVYSQTTDSNGITKFTTAFSADEIDGDISVNVDGFKAEHQKVTLLADRIQDIRLEKTSGTLIVGFTGQIKELVQNPESNNGTTNSDSNGEEDYKCSSELLSPEEKANCGQHSYSYEGTWITGNCFYKLEDGSSAKSTTNQYTEINIFDSGQWISTVDGNAEIYNMVSLNTYEYKDVELGGSNGLIQFTLDGYTIEHNVPDCKLFGRATIIK